MIYVSYSMLKDFGDCNRKAYYHLTKADKVETASLVAGRMIHEAIDDYEKKKTTDFESHRDRMITDLNDESIVFYPRQTVSSFLKRFDKCVANYVAISDELPPVVKTEERFSISFDMIGVTAVGILDQIREGDVICELKSSSRCPSEDMLRADLQATMYIWAYFQLHRKYPVYYYVHLPTGNIFELTRTDFKDLYKLMADFKRTYEEENWIRKRDAWKCNGCWYKDACFQSSEQSSFVLKAVGRPKDKRSKERPDFFAY